MTVDKLPVTRTGATGRRLTLSSLQTFGTTLACLLLVAAVTFGNPTFASANNIENMLSQWAPAGIMAVGMTIVVIGGGFDLSVASNFTLCAVSSALIGTHYSALAAGIGATLVGATAGLGNAILIVVMRINPYIATVGSGFVIIGISLVMTQNAAIIVSNEAFGVLGAGRWHGIPYSGMLMIGLMILSGLLLARSIWGHMVYAVGGNAEASRLSGLPVKWVAGGSYILLGACCGIAGFISASQLNSAQASSDQSILFDVLTIVILGGTSFSGGDGSIWQTAIGLIMVATIANGFVLLNIDPFYQSLFKGLIIILALAMDSTLKHVSKRAVRVAGS